MLRAAFISLSESKSLRSMAEKTWIGQRLSRRLVAGTTVDDALAATKEMNKLGLSVSVDNLGDNVTNADEAPNAKMFAGQLDMDQDGYLKTHDFVMTRVPGVFGCGDVQDRRFRQAITASGSGCAAAIETEKFLEEHGR